MIDLTKTNTVAIIDDIVKASDENKREYFDCWRRNIRRVHGDYISDLEEENSFVKRRHVQAGPKRIFSVLPVANPKLHYAVARELKTALNFAAVPTSLTRKDRMKAKGVTRMLKARFNERGGQDYEEAYRAIVYLKCCSPVFLLVEGDRSKPRPRLLGQTVADRGDVIWKALLPFQVWWYPGLRMEDSPAVVIEEFMAPEEIDRRWPSKDNKAIFADKDVYARWPQESGLDKIEPGINESLISVRRLFIQQCGLFPNGAQRIVIGGKYTKVTLSSKALDESWKRENGNLVERATDAAADLIGRRKKFKPEEEWIGTPDNLLPVVRVQDVPSSPGRLGKGRMDYISSLQRMLNRKFTAYTEISMKTPDIYITAPFKTPLDGMHNEPVFLDQIQPIAGKGLEIALRPPLQPLLDEMAYLESRIDFMLGQPGSSRGEMPGTRTSSRALETAKDYASEIDAPETQLVNSSFAYAQKRLVMEGREVWPQKFKYEAMGENNRGVVREFDQADLASVADIQVGPDDPYPTNKFARWKVANERFKNGGFGDPTKPKTLQKYDQALNIPRQDDDFIEQETQDELVDQHMEELKTGEAPVSVVCDDEYHAEQEMQILGEEVASGNTDLAYQQRVYTHCLLHMLNRRRKDKAQQIGKLADAAEAPPPTTELGNLTPGESQALAQVQQMENAPMEGEPPGALPAPQGVIPSEPIQQGPPVPTV